MSRNEICCVRSERMAKGIMLLFPKPKRKPKKPKPLKRRKPLAKLFKAITRKKPLKRSFKKIKPRAKFHAYGENPLETYRRRYTDAQVLEKANEYRRSRLMNRQPAEIIFAEILDDERILYEIEKIFLNGDRFVICDFVIPGAKLAFEIDGPQHDLQSRYDQQRSDWLWRRYGIRVHRFRNEDVYRQRGAIRQTVIGLLKPGDK